jgi:hypothetical protein
MLIAGLIYCPTILQPLILLHVELVTLRLPQPDAGQATQFDPTPLEQFAEQPLSDEQPPRFELLPELPLLDVDPPAPLEDTLVIAKVVAGKTQAIEKLKVIKKINCRLVIFLTYFFNIFFRLSFPILYYLSLKITIMLARF